MKLYHVNDERGNARLRMLSRCSPGLALNNITKKKILLVFQQMSGITPATCTSRMWTCCVSHRRRSICADLSEEWVRWRPCMENVPLSSLSDVSRSVGLRTEAAGLPMWPQPGWWACGSVTNEQTVMIHRRLKRAIEYHWKLSQRGTFMTFLHLFTIVISRLPSIGGSHWVVSMPSCDAL